MKLNAEVGKLEHWGDAAKITLTNVKRTQGPSWDEYGPEVSFKVPLSRAKSFPIGRTVKITIKAS